MKKILLMIKPYWPELLIGVIILLCTSDIRWFLFYLLLFLILILSHLFDFLRKLIRVFQVANELKLKSIMAKLNVSEEDIKKITDELEEGLTEEQKNSLTKDAIEIGL